MYKDNYKLVFEGDYLNGEKNGMVKKYKDYKLLFEGEYINKKKNETNKK